jgi:branched-chain amino acid transport system permease protein
MLFGPNTMRPATPIPGAIEMFGIIMPKYRLFLIGFGLIVILTVAFIVNRTALGAMVRAAAFDRNMAASLGVPVTKVYAYTFAFGIALAGLAGVLLAPVFSVFPTMGRDFIFMAFTVVIVGGMGSIVGTVIAGLLLTQIQVLSSLIVSPVWSDPIVFSIMVLVLVVRPRGLFGRIGYA